MSWFIDIELRDELLQRSCIFIIHDAVTLEVVFLIDLFDMTYTVEIGDGLHEGFRRNIRVLQLEEDALATEFISFTITRPDAEEGFEERQCLGGRTDEEVIRQVLQG